MSKYVADLLPGTVLQLLYLAMKVWCDTSGASDDKSGCVGLATLLEMGSM
jgi:hypothetical protein